MTWERTRSNREAAIGVDGALARILTHFAPLPTKHVPLLDALGLAVAADVVAEGAVPPFRNSAMDGFAVRSADTTRAPVTLRVTGHVVAGHAAGQHFAAGEAVRIMTG
ncbi:MAG TPA: molybdopterin molybdenumtransferase MoeA, partial [Thermomicrobiales bacterium]|nr:molybdopterin molybdenumtransferase MoeA [Thermomicrobiales bacterium]